MFHSQFSPCADGKCVANHYGTVLVPVPVSDCRTPCQSVVRTAFVSDWSWSWILYIVLQVRVVTCVFPRHRHGRTGAVLVRSGQPEVGWLGWRSTEDEELIKAVSEACAANRLSAEAAPAPAPTAANGHVNGDVPSLRDLSEEALLFKKHRGQSEESSKARCSSKPPKDGVVAHL